MSRRGKREDEPTLFDLPLNGAAAESPEEARSAPPTPEAPEAPEARAEDRAEPEPAELPLDEPPVRPAAPPAPFHHPAPAGPTAGDAVPLSVRFLAGFADLAIHLALAVLLLFGARLLGVSAGLGDWPPLTLFLLTFSFLYTVLPLAFWGQTPGMAWAGVEARAPDGQGLTAGQTVRRWLGALLTVALLGLPVLFALVDGRSLADRLSDSESLLAE